MIFPGTDLKFKITASIPNFNIMEHGCSVEIVNRFGKVKKTIEKSEMFFDKFGNWYFNVENVSSGPIYVRFNAVIPDKDYNKQLRIVTDFQMLCWVGMPPCCCPKDSSSSSTTHNVTYTQVWTVNLENETYLIDNEGNPILDSDGNKISFTGQGGVRTGVQLSMSGEAFKQLIEGRTQDGTIDTLPELFDTASGISDDKTIKEEIEDEAGVTYDESNEKLYLNGAKPKSNNP